MAKAKTESATPTMTVMSITAYQVISNDKELVSLASGRGFVGFASPKCAEKRHPHLPQQRR